ncbi:MAG TPA: SIMPL domain-containing protein [Ornithinibacter sp.]|nr:SIMPL domain-containing protein [Ornithinibacter sp.]
MTDHVEVTGTGAASAVPDVVVLDARVQCEAPDVAGALSAATDRVTTALRAAADHGVAERDRRTTGMGVSTRWDREGRAVVGYTAHQSVRLLVRDRERVGDLIRALAGAAGDAFGLDNVTLEVADPAPLLERARTAAFEDARAKAEQFAALAGRALGPVLRVTEERDHAIPLPRFAAQAAMDAGGGMPVEAGESTVTASVTVRFGLGQQ